MQICRPVCSWLIFQNINWSDWLIMLADWLIAWPNEWSWLTEKIIDHDLFQDWLTDWQRAYKIKQLIWNIWAVAVAQCQQMAVPGGSGCPHNMRLIYELTICDWLSLFNVAFDTGWLNITTSSIKVLWILTIFYWPWITIWNYLQ